MKHYDVIVAGIGGMGSAAAYHLARRGRRVLGLERFGIPHEMGSSHGQTRIIRLPYHENPAYVPLLRRAFELWRELQRPAGEQLLYVTGSLEVGGPGSPVVEGSRRSCEEHGLPHEMLDGAEVMRRFPALRVPAGTTALLQADGGFLLPERCIAAHAGLAEMHGAEIHRHEPLLGWEPHGDGVIVHTARGAYRADRLVISAGPWAGKLIEALAGLAAPERQVLAWFEPLRPELFALGRLPVFIVDTGTRNYYGFPVIDASGFKIGLHHHLRQAADPDALDRTVHPEDEEALRACVERYFPDGAGRTLTTQVCMYTNTPDGHFILDLHPGCPQVSIAAGFSGHGFKFCSVVGEVMADLAETGATRHDIGMFRLGRFAGAGGPMPG